MSRPVRPRDPFTVLADLIGRVLRLERSHGATDTDGALRTTFGVNGGYVGTDTPTGGQQGDFKVGHGKVWYQDDTGWHSIS